MKALFALLLLECLAVTAAVAAQPQGATYDSGDTSVAVTIESPALFQRPAGLQEDVAVAKTPPRVEFLEYPGQDYEGNPWSVWGDGLAVGDLYYSAIGDHRGPRGNAFVYRYDARSGELKRIVDVQQTIGMPQGHYTPGKIHSRIDLGADGWLYFSTHRGGTRVTTDENHYKGDWILRHHPQKGFTEVVAHAPLPKQCLPTSVLDPQRLIFYAGTADGDHRNKRVQFLAYDVRQRKVIYSDDAGPYRAIIFAPSTGRVYYQQEGGRGETLPLVRFDPAAPGPPHRTEAKAGLRTCTIETPEGIVYTVDGDNLWAFDTRAETARRLGGTAVGTQDYIATIDVDPATWRYLYYVPGAHGGGHNDGSPLVQYDVRNNTRKVIAFLHPAVVDATGYTCMGTYGLAVSPAGDRVYITWNGNRGGPERGRLRFNACALTVVHIPESERVR
jgi:hypothetical protein